MSNISGRAISKKYIEVYGQVGEFNISNKKIKVKYFSTIASGKDPGSDQYKLLQELKPMRERVNANQIGDLNSLLQRDLNDFRVANELIPYLTKDNPQIAFFPAVLAVLIPKDFLAKTEDSYYPTGQETRTDNDNRLISYGELWKLETYKIDGNDSNLGILMIDEDNVHVVVLDGQHRSNAFRVVSGTFADQKNSIHAAFYNETPKIEGFNADLPVTIIWFDNEEDQFDPKVVSRRLFVDVNNSAKSVSKSRTILLDEYEIPSLLTRFFYSKLAEERKFTASKFSLFHGDFDLDSDINVSSNNAFALTNPQIIYDVFSWITLGRDRYNELDRYGVSREAFRNSVSTFGGIFNAKDFNENDIFPDDESLNRKRVVLKDVSKLNVFEEKYKETLSPVLYNIFSKFNLFKKHYEASEEVENIYRAGQMDTTEITVWEDVFCGGEGLYYTFKDINTIEKKNPSLDKYVKAINQIETKFKEIRGSLFDGIQERKVNAAFNSANTKAFQIGLFMALDVYRNQQPYSEMYDEYLEELNKKTEKDWIYVLTDIRQKIVKGTDPKKWPAYQKLILRAIQTESNLYYDNSNFRISPDGKVFYDLLKTSFNSWLELNEEVDYEEIDTEKIGNAEINKWIQSAEESTEDLFQLASISPIPDIEYRVVGREIIEELINSIRD